MRRARQDVCLVKDNDAERPVGISLGWDHCAEHEFGIDEIRSEFGILGKPSRECMGVEVRIIRKNSDRLWLLENCDGFSYLMFPIYTGDIKKKAPKEVAQRFNLHLGAQEWEKDEEIIASWSRSSFGIRIKHDDTNPILSDIYKAFIQKDIIIFQQGACSPFGGSGLMIWIRSRIPESVLRNMKEVDEAEVNLCEKDESTNIRQKLKDEGMQYFALSPRIAEEDEMKERGTAYPVIYWLNPYDQRNHNWGWFTVEELEQWIEGTGPVMKTNNV